MLCVVGIHSAGPDRVYRMLTRLGLGTRCDVPISNRGCGSFAGGVRCACGGWIRVVRCAVYGFGGCDHPWDGFGASDTGRWSYVRTAFFVGVSPEVGGGVVPEIFLMVGCVEVECEVFVVEF